MGRTCPKPFYFSCLKCFFSFNAEELENVQPYQYLKLFGSCTKKIWLMPKHKRPSGQIFRMKERVFCLVQDVVRSSGDVSVGAGGGQVGGRLPCT